MLNFVEKLYSVPKIQELAKKKGIILSIHSHYIDVISVLPHKGPIFSSPYQRIVKGLTRPETFALDAGWEGRLFFNLCQTTLHSFNHRQTPHYWHVCYCDVSECNERQRQAYAYGQKLRKLLSPRSAFFKGKPLFYFDKSRVRMFSS